MNEQIKQVIDILAVISIDECKGTGDCEGGVVFPAPCELHAICQELHELAERIQDLREVGKI